MARSSCSSVPPEAAASRRPPPEGAETWGGPAFLSSVRAALALGVAMLTGCAGTAPAPDNTELRDQVMATERAFARTMATRDFAAFASFLSDEAVFFGASKVMRGKEQVAAAWKPFYEKPQA